MTTALVQKLTGVRDLKKILETTVKEIGETFSADSCQIMLSNPLDPNVTSICEFRAYKGPLPDNLPSVTMPLVIHGRTFGALSMSRQSEVNKDEVNTMRVILGELGDIIRHAQINDIIQRDTFRDTFLIEIGNVMAYSLGIGDALFMVVNILGKVLQASRCLFICTDDTQAGWKCYEFWQQDKVQSCQDFYWPTTHSPLVAQVLLSKAPLKVFEGQLNSYVSPVQDELQLIGVKSLLGVPLRSAEGTHGCVILQQCDYRRAWTRGEIDMVQNVADKVAEALVKLPAEKRAREPIMQLHQRIVQPADGAQGKATMQSVRNALKGALGHQAIQSARKTSQPDKPPAPAAPAAPPPAAAPAASQSAPAASQAAPATAPAAPPPAPVAQIAPSQVAQEQAAAVQSFAPATQAAETPSPTITPVSRAARPTGDAAAVAPGQTTGGNAFASLVAPGAVAPSRPTEELPLPVEEEDDQAETSATLPVIAHDVLVQSREAAAPAADPYANLDFGEYTDFTDFTPPAGATAAPAPPAPPPAPPQEAAPAPAQEAAPAPAPQAETSKWGDLDAIPTPKGAPPQAPSQWGDLDAIPTPQGAAAPTAAGLRGKILGKSKGRSDAAAASPLMASFHKDKSQFQSAQTAQAAAEPAEKAEFVSGPPIEIDEAKAQAKLAEILSSANPTSDYVFSTPGLDARMLGRIDGWVSQIEAKDKYAHGHARQVAELSVAIAAAVGLEKKDIEIIRQAALVHDVGKLGAAAQILQKRDEELSDPELITVMRHPIDGAELLESFPDLAHLAPIVRAHHEEYSGEGYPQGLKGDEIPVAARIICLANAYHNMVSEMRYGPGISPAAAQEELAKGAGRQWDPTLVQAFLQLLTEGKVAVK
ncbi:MAG TPA: HD domain-containing phosphohydrolase [Candidatus Obscuribacterales bacterium]